MGVSIKQSTPSFAKNEHFLPPDMHMYVCISGGKKCLFFRKFGMLCVLETPVFRSALLPITDELQQVSLYYVSIKLNCFSLSTKRNTFNGILDWPRTIFVFYLERTAICIN